VAQSNGSIAYRDQVAGESELVARIGRPGESDLRFRWKVSETDPLWAYTCYGSTQWYTLSVDGHDLLSTTCAKAPTLDAGADPARFDGPVLGGARLGDTVTVRLHLTPGPRRSREVAHDPDVVLGLGIYGTTGPRHRVAGREVADTSEHEGHTWLASRWEQSRPGARSLRVGLPASDTPRLYTWVASGLSGGPSRVDLKVSPKPGGRGSMVEQNENAAGGGQLSGSGYVVQPGETPDVIVEVPHGSTSRTRLGLVVSDLVQ
jgi:hypothetical protein